MNAGPNRGDIGTGHGGARCLPIGRALSLIGGLALVTAYFTPWFATQGVNLSGSFLGQFLAGTSDLGRFLPGSSGGSSEVLLLRGLVYSFPSIGGVAAVASLVATIQPAVRTLANVVLVLGGLLPLIALGLGVSRLPPGATVGVGLWQIGLGSLAILIGVSMDWVLLRGGRDHSMPCGDG